MFNLTELLNKAADFLEDSADKAVKNAEQQYALADLLEDVDLRDRLLTVIEDATELGRDILTKLTEVFDTEEKEETVFDINEPLNWDLKFEFPKGAEGDELFNLITGGIYNSKAEEPEQAPEPTPEPEEPKVSTDITGLKVFGLSDDDIARIQKIVDDLKDGKGGVGGFGGFAF